MENEFVNDKEGDRVSYVSHIDKDGCTKDIVDAYTWGKQWQLSTYAFNNILKDDNDYKRFQRRSFTYGMKIIVKLFDINILIGFIMIMQSDITL